MACCGCDDVPLLGCVFSSSVTDPDNSFFNPMVMRRFYSFVVTGSIVPQTIAVHGRLSVSLSE